MMRAALRSRHRAFQPARAPASGVFAHAGRSGRLVLAAPAQEESRAAPAASLSSHGDELRLVLGLFATGAFPLVGMLASVGVLSATWFLVLSAVSLITYALALAWPQMLTGGRGSRSNAPAIGRRHHVTPIRPSRECQA